MTLKCYEIYERKIFKIRRKMQCVISIRPGRLKARYEIKYQIYIDLIEKKKKCGWHIE